MIALLFIKSPLILHFLCFPPFLSGYTSFNRTTLSPIWAFTDFAGTPHASHARDLLSETRSSKREQGRAKTNPCSSLLPEQNLHVIVCRKICDRLRFHMSLKNRFVAKRIDQQTYLWAKHYPYPRFNVVVSNQLPHLCLHVQMSRQIEMHPLKCLIFWI